MNEQYKGSSCKWLVLALLSELAMIALGIWVFKTWSSVNIWGVVAFCGVFAGGVCMVLSIAMKCESECRKAYYEYCKARMDARGDARRLSNALVDLVRKHAADCHAQGKDDLIRKVILTSVDSINEETSKGRWNI